MTEIDDTELAKLRHDMERLYDVTTSQQAEIERLRAALEDAIDTLEAMDLHIDNPLYGRLCVILEKRSQHA